MTAAAMVMAVVHQKAASNPASGWVWVAAAAFALFLVMGRRK